MAESSKSEQKFKGSPTGTVEKVLERNFIWTKIEAKIKISVISFVNFGNWHPA